MGFLDFIGDALGALTSPFTAVLDAGTKLLGLPPAIGDALKIAVGVATGDVVTLMQGSTQLMKDLAASSAETEYAPRADEAYGGADGWAPAASDGTDVTDSPELSAGGSDVDSDVDPEEAQALETLAGRFDDFNRDHGLFGAFGDKVITEKELRETAEDPDAPLDLKRAARYVLDNPDLMDRLARSKDGSDQGIARGDVDLALAEDRSGGGGTSGTDGSRGTPAGGDALSALQTILGSFDDLDTMTGGWLPPDKVLSQDELERAAAAPDTSPVLKRALRYVLDHHDLLDSLSRSQGYGVSGISRTDLQIGIEDARRSGSSSPTSGPRPAPKPAPAPSSGGTKSSSSSKTKDPSITDILNDKNLSVEEKIEMILMVLENRTDDQMLSITQQMDRNDDKKTAKDDRKKVAKLDKVDRDLNFKMERVMKQKEQLSNLLSTMEMKFAAMAQTAIANMAR
jgi:hypothetical protein